MRPRPHENFCWNTILNEQMWIWLDLPSDYTIDVMDDAFENLKGFKPCLREAMWVLNYSSKLDDFSCVLQFAFAYYEKKMHLNEYHYLHYLMRRKRRRKQGVLIEQER